VGWFPLDPGMVLCVLSAKFQTVPSTTLMEEFFFFFFRRWGLNPDGGVLTDDSLSSGLPGLTHFILRVQHWNPCTNTGASRKLQQTWGFGVKTLI